MYCISSKSRMIATVYHKYNVCGAICGQTTIVLQSLRAVREYSDYETDPQGL